jgi:hypothetical protein
MANPAVISEIGGGNLDTVYSNIDLGIFVVERDNAEAGDPAIIGPFLPTQIFTDLGKIFPYDPDITPETLRRQPETRYF